MHGIEIEWKLVRYRMIGPEIGMCQWEMMRFASPTADRRRADPPRPRSAASGRRDARVGDAFSAR